MLGHGVDAAFGNPNKLTRVVERHKYNIEMIVKSM